MRWCTHSTSTPRPPAAPFPPFFVLSRPSHSCWPFPPAASTKETSFHCLLASRRAAVVAPATPSQTMTSSFPLVFRPRTAPPPPLYLSLADVQVIPPSSCCQGWPFSFSSLSSFFPLRSGSWASLFFLFPFSASDGFLVTSVLLLLPFLLTPSPTSTIPFCSSFAPPPALTRSSPLF